MLMLHAGEITNERVRILYTKAPASLSTAISGAIIYAFLFREQIAWPVLALWIGFMFLVTLYRVWLVFDYKKNKDNTPIHSKFENRFVLAVSLIGAGWAFIIFQGLILPAFEYRIYSLLFLVSIISISVPVFSSSMRALYFYVTPSLVVSIPLLLARGGDDALLGTALIIFSAMVLRAAKDFYHTLIDSFTARFQAQEMTKNMKQLNHDKSETEQRMQGIMDYSPAAIYVKDLDGHFTFLNQKVAELHKMKREEIIGKTVHDLLPQNMADVIHQNDLDVIKAGKSIKYEENAPQDDGIHHYLSIKFPLFDESGEICAVGGVSTDITERFRIEESLRISQQRLLLHREQSPLGIIEWNTDFEFLEWNPAAQKIFGFSEEEVQGHHITERILPESVRPAVNKIWEDLLANKGGFYSLNENITKDGRIIMCEWHNTPLVDQDGNVIGVTSLVEDVTKRQRDEENLRHSQKMDAIGKLTGGIAHDFNNMLGVILGYSELLTSCVVEDNPKLTKYSDQIITAAERAKKLTSKLLEFSRKAPSSAETTHINKLLEGMRDMLQKTLTPRIELEMNLQENLWPVWLDKTQLEDAVLNISINAMHAMPDGGRLTLTSQNIQLAEKDIHNMDINAGDYVLLSLDDTGLGMSQEVQSRIFEPFFTTKGTEGTGLGLSQVYGFLQQSQCGIHIQSELGHGTRIAIYIPRHHETENEKSVERLIESKDLPSGEEVILVVDDEVALLDLAKEILTNCGYTVLCAENAEQALQILISHHVDLMFSDVIMPGKDGYQLATEVAKLYPEIIIQMVSGYSDNLNLNLVDDKLYQQRLHKPYSSEQILLRIRDLLDE